MKRLTPPKRNKHNGHKKEQPKGQTQYQGNGRIEMNMIRNIAWSFQNTTGMEFDDLVQEAAYAWWAWAEGAASSGVPKYDPRKCAFTSFAHMCVRSHLTTLASKEMKKISTVPMPDYDLNNHEITPDERTIFLDELKKAPIEVILVAEMIFNSPSEFLCESTPGKMQTAIVNRLEERYNMTRRDARAALAKLKVFLDKGLDALDFEGLDALDTLCLSKSVPEPS